MTPTSAHQLPRRLDELAWRIATLGIERCEDDITIIARQALERGADPLLAGVLIDRDAPAIARERAFGRVIAAFRHSQPRVLVAA